MRFKRYGDPLVQKRRSPGTVTEEDRKRWKRDEYQRNHEKYKARAARWRVENEEKYRENKRVYFGRDDVKETSRKRVMEWKKNNPERKRENDKRWRENNIDKKRSHQAFRRAKVKSATPPWLTKEHKKQIGLIYKEALRLTQETGILFHVDHVVPLNGRTVSGLHVPWNLQVMKAEDNHRKSNKTDHLQ